MHSDLYQHVYSAWLLGYYPFSMLDASVGNLHSSVSGWPKDHNFKFYGLKIQDIFLIDWYGGAKTLSVDEYLSANQHSSL